MSAQVTPRRPWYQFSLRTMFVAVTALAILLAQWPFMGVRTVHDSFIATAADGTTYRHGHIGRLEVWINPRFKVVLAIEITIVIGWWGWRRFKNSRATLPTS